MSQTDKDFSTQNITPQLIAQVVDALRNKQYGSVEIYIQNFNVVQITERTITKVIKTSVSKRNLSGNGQQNQTIASPRNS